MATTKTVDKWKKKKWYTIKTPTIMDGREITTTPAEKPEQVMGRTIRMSARDLSGQPKKSHYLITMKVSDVQGLSAQTSLVGFEVPPALVKKYVRRRKSKVDLVQNITFSSGVKGRLKTLVLFNFEVPKSIETQCRHMVAKSIAEIASTRHVDQFLMELLFGNGGQTVADSLKNLGSVKKVEFLSFKSLSK